MRSIGAGGPSFGVPFLGVPSLGDPSLRDGVVVVRCNFDARIFSLGRNLRRVRQRAPGGDVLPRRFEQLADAFAGRAGDGVERQADLRRVSFQAREAIRIVQRVNLVGDDDLRAIG